ncbi:MAG: cysteine desulfurase [Lachnospiraceae bacterium]|nr:cysteine desulfurase [Lachnospiraceae bacterium]
MIYLDNASTTRIDPEVLDAMMPYMQDGYGNPGTLYKMGRQAKAAVDNARLQVADFIEADPHQIIFTSSGTEANNMVFFSLAENLKRTKRKHIITSATEHDSVLKAVNSMCIKHGFYKSIIDVDEYGLVIPKILDATIKEDTGIVSVMYVNNETGAENDVEEIGRLCRERGVYFHTDCVQAAGSFDIDVNKIRCDFLSLSSHKIHGPKGCGALYARPEVLTPFISGGVSQEFGLRGGTENVAAIVGFGKACEIAKKEIRNNDIYTSTLKQMFFTELDRVLGCAGLDGILHINGDSLIRHGKILNVRFDGVDGETLLLMLDSRGVCVSAGSACRSRESEPSHVLTAMGISPDDARNSIRVSFSKMNSSDEVLSAARIIAECAGGLYNGND